MNDKCSNRACLACYPRQRQTKDMPMRDTPPSNIDADRLMECQAELRLEKAFNQATNVLLGLKKEQQEYDLQWIAHYRKKYHMAELKFTLSVAYAIIITMLFVLAIIHMHFRGVL